MNFITIITLSLLAIIVLVIIITCIHMGIKHKRLKEQMQEFEESRRRVEKHAQNKN
jgi:UDP-N-acetylmuramate-alanine ligase